VRPSGAGNKKNTPKRVQKMNKNQLPIVVYYDILTLILFSIHNLYKIINNYGKNYQTY